MVIYKKHWKPEETEKLLQLHQEGLTPLKITKHLPNRGKDGIRRKLIRLGHQPNTQRPQQTWTPQEEKQAQQLRTSGLTYKEIGEKLGRSRKSIYKKLNPPIDNHKRKTGPRTVEVKKDNVLEGLYRINLHQIVEAKTTNHYEYKGLPSGVDFDKIDLAIEYGEWRVL